MYLGYRDHYDDPIGISRAYACESLFINHRKKVFFNDLTVGSSYGLLAEQYGVNKALLKKSTQIVNSYGNRTFLHNVDHYAPDYATILSDGVGGILEKIHSSMEKYVDDEEKTTFLKSTEIAITAFGKMIAQYGEEARKTAQNANETQQEQLLIAADICDRISVRKTGNFS